MRIFLQRVSSASVSIDHQIRGQIQRGYVLLLGLAPTDTSAHGEWLAQKIASLRLFPDEAGLMNKSIRDIAGEILVISQFTLFADVRKGTRPSFNAAAHPSHAKPLYETFLQQMTTALGRPVAHGEFGADMKVALVNDGPVTLVLEYPPPA